MGYRHLKCGIDNYKSSLISKNRITIDKEDISMYKLIDLETYPVKDVLSRLLQDKTTRKNIIFATDAYTEKGKGFSAKDPITVDKLLGDAGVPNEGKYYQSLRL